MLLSDFTLTRKLLRLVRVVLGPHVALLQLGNRDFELFARCGFPRDHRVISRFRGFRFFGLFGFLLRFLTVCRVWLVVVLRLPFGLTVFEFLAFCALGLVGSCQLLSKLFQRGDFFTHCMPR
ncbi:hypothetical protein D3C86_1451700 [compost metagenome]